MSELELYGGVPVDELARAVGAARVHAFDAVESTMDVAHELARGGAAHGTVIVAETQTAGRGRARREWLSPEGGMWLTLLLRELAGDDLLVLPLRVGIAAASALDEFASERIGLKWPNDLFVGDRKLGGILVEARWRGDMLDWVAIGIGINTATPSEVNAAALEPGVRRSAVLTRLLRGVFEAVRSEGALSDSEFAEFTARDVARGRPVSAPVPGIVRGVTAGGALLLERDGAMQEIRSGSLVFATNPPSFSDVR